MSPPHSTLRPLSASDLDAATAVVLASGLGTGRGDLALHAALSSVRTGAWRDDRLVGVAGAILYGNVGVVGPMSVLPSEQGRGIGTLLLREVVDWLRGHGAQAVTLDATAAGAPLYRRHGFVTDYQTILLTRRPASASANSRDAASNDARPVARDDVRPLTLDDLAEIERLDTPIFGASRRDLLAHYLSDDATLGLLLHRAGRAVGYLLVRQARFGPFVAVDPGAADMLLTAASALPTGDVVSAALPATNEGGIAALVAHGFTESRRLDHMRLGGTHPLGEPERIFGIASFSFG